MSQLPLMFGDPAPTDPPPASNIASVPLPLLDIEPPPFPYEGDAEGKRDVRSEHDRLLSEHKAASERLAELAERRAAAAVAQAAWLADQLEQIPAQTAELERIKAQYDADRTAEQSVAAAVAGGLLVRPIATIEPSPQSPGKQIIARPTQMPSLPRFQPPFSAAGGKTSVGAPPFPMRGMDFGFAPPYAPPPSVATDKLDPLQGLRRRPRWQNIDVRLVGDAILYYCKPCEMWGRRCLHIYTEQDQALALAASPLANHPTIAAGLRAYEAATAPEPPTAWLAKLGPATAKPKAKKKGRRK